MLKFWKMFWLRWQIADLAAEVEFLRYVDTVVARAEYMVLHAELRAARARLALLEDPAKQVSRIINRRIAR